MATVYLNFFSCSRLSQTDFTALWGHTRMQVPQSMQRLGRMVAFPFRTRMASVGQFLMQVVQPRHFFRSRTTEWRTADTSSLYYKW